MSALDTIVLSPIEGALDAVGLMRGPTAPLMRAVVGAGIGAGISYGLRPEISFRADGSPRPWVVTDSGAPDATLIPHWMPSFAGAVFLGILI